MAGLLDTGYVPLRQSPRSYRSSDEGGRSTRTMRGFEPYLGYGKLLQLNLWAIQISRSPAPGKMGFARDTLKRKASRWVDTWQLAPAGTALRWLDDDHQHKLTQPN